MCNHYTDDFQFGNHKNIFKEQGKYFKLEYDKLFVPFGKVCYFLTSLYYIFWFFFYIFCYNISFLIVLCEEEFF